MQRYLLKNSTSKSQVRDWLHSSMASYSAAAPLKWNDEDSLCEAFFSAISGRVATPSGAINIRSYKVRGHGPRAPEKKLGADGLGIVNIHTDETRLSGYFLFQAKKALDFPDTLSGARTQCVKMLEHSAASYLLILLPTGVKMAGAMAVGAYQSIDPSLRDVPYVDFSRFVIEQLLQGLMLEPFEKAQASLTPDLRREIRYVLAVMGGTEQLVERAVMSTHKELRELELDALTDIDR